MSVTKVGGILTSPIRFISQLLRNSQREIDTNLPTPDLKRIEQLLYKEKLVESLREVEDLENKYELNQGEQIQSQILKSLINTRMGNFNNGLQIAEQAIKTTQKIKDKILSIEVLIAKATSLFELGQFDPCLNVIDECRSRTKTLDKDQPNEITEREAILKYIQGKVYWKQGNLNDGLEYLKSSLTVKQELDNNSDVVDILNCIGIMYFNKGELEPARTIFDQCLDMSEKHGLYSSIAKSINNIGMIYWKKGELDQALDSYKSSLVIYEELENKKNIARVLLNIGLISWNKGELDDAINFYQKSLAEYEELENKSEKALCLNNIAIVYQFKGELDYALQMYQESKAIHERLGNKLQIAFCLNNIGEIHHIKGDINEASDYYQKSLDLFEEIGNTIDVCETLFNLVTIAIDKGSIDDTHPYLQKLQEINIKEESKYINQKYRLAQAMVLKQSSRVVKIAEAQKIFQQIVQEEMISLEHKVTANLNLCELLLQELRTSGDEEVLTELKEVLSQLCQMAEEQNSYIWLAKTNWLQSKIALLEFDLDRSQRLLTRAETIAREKGFIKLSTNISSERVILLNQFNKWEQILEKKPSVSEIIELTQIEGMLERMIQKKLDVTEERTMEYAIEARRLVDVWKEEKEADT
ncbi:MAG: tetratricopeptide repeat protein [Candidatus Hodarchaeales archaeon]|jgi:tetratricopeptide (TPR) repeat protein